MTDTKNPADEWRKLADWQSERLAKMEAEIARLKEHAVVLANTAAHVEREACAKECDRWVDFPGAQSGASKCAAAIRAREDAHE